VKYFDDPQEYDEPPEDYDADQDCEDFKEPDNEPTPRERDGWRNAEVAWEVTE